MVSSDRTACQQSASTPAYLPACLPAGAASWLVSLRSRCCAAAGVQRALISKTGERRAPLQRPATPLAFMQRAYDRAYLIAMCSFNCGASCRMGMGPGGVGPSITVMQPDGPDDEKIWKKFGASRRIPTPAEELKSWGAVHIRLHPPLICPG